jgi:phosphate transport system protein
MSTHIVRAYEDQLNKLRESIGRMGGMVESQIAAAIEAVSKRDPELAATIVRGDAPIDEMERQIDDLAIHMLALRQPVASDLRTIVGALRIAAALERIADYAKNVAKRAVALAQMPPVEPAHAIPRMGRAVREMIKDVLDAYVLRDVEKARAVWIRDEELDAMHASLFRELLTYMMEDPRYITPSTHLLFIAKNLERVGDHATNIAEMVHYQVTGTPLIDERPKHDQASRFVASQDKAEPT